MTRPVRLPKTAARLAAAALTLGLLSPLPATPASDFSSAAFTEQRPYLWESEVADTALADIRGGILLSDGYIIDFGIEVTTTINGQVVQSVLSTSFIQDLATVAQKGTVIQIGEGNSLPAELADELSAFVTIIQNNTEGADITQTLNATINVNNFDTERLVRTSVIQAAIDATRR